MLVEYTPPFDILEMNFDKIVIILITSIGLLLEVSHNQLPLKILCHIGLIKHLC